MSNVTLKARAKRLRTAIAAMFQVPVTTAQSLELVAQEENFPNWDAASANYTPLASQPAQDTRKNVTAAGLLGLNSQTGTFVVAPPGSGKHLVAMQEILDQLRLGKTVVVLDRGAGYYKAAEALGGTYYFLGAEGDFEIRQFGEAPLVVYDFDRMPSTGGVSWHADLPGMPPRVLTAEGFLAIDETCHVRASWPKVVSFAEAVTTGGGSLCITGQLDADVREFKACSVPVMKTIRLEVVRRRTKA